MEMRDTKRFPLREAYAFAEQNGLGERSVEIRNMDVEWDRPYTSSVRRGRLIHVFEERGLLEKFFQVVWPAGKTTQGKAECRRCLKITSQYEEFLQGKGPEEEEIEPAEEEALQFALEAHLRDFLAKNLDRIEPGLRLYSKDGVNGVEFAVDAGRIDILAVDKEGKFVVVELKLSLGRNKTLGQLLYYMGWVDTHLGNGPCRGVIVAAEISDELATAVARAPGVGLARYRMAFSIERVK